MNKSVTCLLSSVILFSVCVLPTSALVGAGFQWGFDFTLEMDDVYDDHLAFTQQVIDPNQFISVNSIPDLASYLPSGITADSLDALITENINTFSQRAPFTLSRFDWGRSKINLGGKVFIDAVPIIDAVEVAFNLAAWEYDAVLKYPGGQLQSNITAQDIDDFVTTANYEKILQMDSTHLTLDEFGMSYLKVFGLSKTPYFKFHLDLTVRKNIIAKPSASKLFKLYLGGGPSFHLGTPILTSDFVEEVLKSTIESSANDLGNISNSMGEAVLKNILEDLIEKSKNPTWGMHIVAGTMVKPPVIPLAFFADAKFMIPFGEMDDQVELDGLGFLINLGIALSL